MSGFWARYTSVYVHKRHTYTVESAPTETGSVFMRRFRLFLGQCAGVKHFMFYCFLVWLPCYCSVKKYTPIHCFKVRKKGEQCDIDSMKFLPLHTQRACMLICTESKVHAVQNQIVEIFSCIHAHWECKMQKNCIARICTDRCVGGGEGVVKDSRT